MDLFYRLNTFSLNIQPLRERREDIPLLARHFLYCFSTKYNKKTVKKFSPGALELLISHSWPGNVRELKNVIERIVVLEGDKMIHPHHLPKEFYAAQTSAVASSGGNGFLLPDGGISLDEVEKNLILQALERTRNNKAQAAKLLSISYDALRYQVKKFRLE